MENVIVLIVFLSSMVFIFLTLERRDKAEIKRFREFVFANKATNIEEYAQVIPEDDDFVEDKEDEFIDLDQLSPEELLDIKQKEYAGQ